MEVEEKQDIKPKRKNGPKANKDNTIQFTYLLEDFKSINIPTNDAEKKSLLSKLKKTIIDIDYLMKKLISKKDSYYEIISLIEIDLQKRNDFILKQSQQDNRISIIQEELYKFNLHSKTLYDFTPLHIDNNNPISVYNYFKCPKYIGEVAFKENVSYSYNINNLCIVESGEKEMNTNASMSCSGHNQIRDMKDADVNIENYEDFNDMDNCAGLLNYSADHSGIKVNNHNEIKKKEDDDVEMKSNEKVKETFALRERNDDGNNQLDENHKENHLEERYTLFKKEKKKKKAKEKKGNLSNKDDQTLYNTQDFPDIESMDDDKLKEQCKVYGLKPLSNKAMKKQLKEIYVFLSTKQLPENLKKSLTHFLDEDENNKDGQSSALKCKVKGKSKGNISINSQSSLGVLTEQKKQQIVEIIKEERNLWEKILLFQKIELKEIKTVLIKAKIIVGNDILKEFLLGLGVVFGGGWNNNDNKK